MLRLSRPPACSSLPRLCARTLGRRRTRQSLVGRGRVAASSSTLPSIGSRHDVTSSVPAWEGLRNRQPPSDDVVPSNPVTCCGMRRRWHSLTNTDATRRHEMFAGRPGVYFCGTGSTYYAASCRSVTTTTIQGRFLSTVAAQLEDEEAGDSGAEEVSKERSRSKAGRTVPGIRNVAIVAHVDHGKTTLVDELLRAAAASSSSSSKTDGNNDEATGDARLVMDSGELERERGITITSKVTRLDYERGPQQPSSPANSPPLTSHENLTINVVDTPGHADFAGEVDRILSMIDGVCLVVDAAEGPMAQTKYVLSRALKRNLTPIVVLNKADRPDGFRRIESGEVEMEILELFDALGADGDLMDYPTVYASARMGWATTDLDVARGLVADTDTGAGAAMSSPSSSDHTMRVLLDVIEAHIPPPVVTSDDEDNGDGGEEVERFALAATTVGYDQFLGRLCTGRIYSGSVRKNDSVRVIPRGTDADLADASGPPPSTSTVSGVFVNRGADRTPLDPPVASAGDIVTLAGVPDGIAVGDTLTSASDPVLRGIDTPPLAPPTLSMDFGANTGPLAGSEGTILTSSRVWDRLVRETDNNVTLAIAKSEADAEKTVVYARGELQLGILIEQMRREGFELNVSPPKIVTRVCEDTGRAVEPYEEVTIDVDSAYSGVVVNALTGARKGVLMEMSDTADDKSRLVFEIPSRGLLGFSSEIATLTRGTAVVNHCFVEDRERVKGLGLGLEKGKLVSNDSGKAALYALASISDRGELFVEPGDLVYPGMVIGQNAKPGDLDVNPVRSKQTSNVRTVNKDEKLYVPPPRRMSVEELIGYMNEDEVIEVTPKSVRLRKAELDGGARARAARSKKKQQRAAKEAVGRS